MATSRPQNLSLSSTSLLIVLMADHIRRVACYDPPPTGLSTNSTQSSNLHLWHSGGIPRFAASIHRSCVTQPNNPRPRWRRAWRPWAQRSACWPPPPNSSTVMLLRDARVTQRSRRGSPPGTLYMTAAQRYHHDDTHRAHRHDQQTDAPRRQEAGGGGLRRGC